MTQTWMARYVINNYKLVLFLCVTIIIHIQIIMLYLVLIAFSLRQNPIRIYFVRDLTFGVGSFWSDWFHSQVPFARTELNLSLIRLLLKLEITVSQWGYYYLSSSPERVFHNRRDVVYEISNGWLPIGYLSSYLCIWARILYLIYPIFQLRYRVEAVKGFFWERTMTTVAGDPIFFF